MGFLNPALLLLGVAALVPIVLHLFQRHQGPRLIFPALRYLRRAEHESARRLRLRQLLLMLLRVAALLLLALAAARPYTRASGAAHLPTAVVFVLDNSMSSGAVVGDTRVLDELGARALETLALAGPDDRFWLIRAGAPWEPALTGDALEIAARVRETEPVATGADLAGALARARTVLAGGADGRAREIQLLTDLQATSLAAGAGPADDAALVVWAPRGAPPPNNAVTALDVAGGLAPVAGERTSIVASVGGAGADSLAVRLSVDGRVTAVATTAPGAAAVLTMPAREAGYVEGFVEIDADALRIDDRRYFAVQVRPAPAVAVSAPHEFVDHALAVIEAAQRVRVVGMTAAELAILPAGVGLESVAPGRSVLVLPPENPVELPAVNRRLAAAGIPWQLEPPTGDDEARFAAVTADPLLRPLEQVRIHSYHTLRRTGVAADTVLLALQDGTPWAVRGERAGGGRFVLFGSPLDERATTLPATPALLPLLDRVLGSWLAPQAVAAEASPGATIALLAAADSVLRADGVIEPLGQATEYRLRGEPGVYRFFAGDSLLQVVAVNPPAEESDLRRLSTRQARAVLGADATITDAPRDWERAIYHARLGRELWRPFLLAALLLLIAQALIAASGRRPRERRGQES